MFRQQHMIESANLDTNWNLGWTEDVRLADVNWDDVEQPKKIQQIDYNEFYLDVPEKLYKEPQKESGVTHFLKENFRLKDCNSGINFAYIHDQDMTYYQEPTSYYQGNHEHGGNRDLNQTSMFGPEPSGSRENDLDYDPDYDKAVNKILEEFEEELTDSKELKVEKVDEDDRDRYEDCYDDFPPEQPVAETPLWYSRILKEKQNITINRLTNLSSLVCYASAKAWEHIKRVKQDHHTPFCKLNPPRYPPLDKPWQNYWKFNCITKCNVDPSEPNHAHTSDCEEIVLEHYPTTVSTKTASIICTEFPTHVMDTVQVFQNFINQKAKHNPYLDPNVVPDTVYEKPSWCSIQLRANYKNEILMIVNGKGLTPLLKDLIHLFKRGAGRALNVVSLWCVNIRWSQKKSKFPPTHLCGELDLRDKVGPITIKYNTKNNISFNSAEAEQLGRVMMQYLNPTQETTVIDIGCNFGALSLMLATKSDKVIGLSQLDHEIQMAEELKKNNNINNASFIVCTPQDVHTKCSPFVKKSISVAVLNLNSGFGKCAEVMKSLRNLPTVWRVALYGTFDLKFQKHITILTSSDHHLGDEFLPMQGCILERSPTRIEDFHIVVVFERKSLIESSIDLIGCGPSVNVKEDLDHKSVKPIKIPGIKTSELVSRGYGKYRQFDSPALPKPNKVEDVKPVVSPPSKENESVNLLPPDYGKPVPKKPPIDIAKLYDTTPNPTIYKQLKKVFDSPLLPKTNDSTNTESNRKSNSPPQSNICDQAGTSAPITISTDPRFDFLSRSRPSYPISTDPRCDFLDEIVRVKQEPFDQKKALVPKKERNNVGSTKPKKDKINYPSIFVKKEYGNSSWSTSSQDSNSRSPPPVKREPFIEAPAPRVPFRRDVKTETMNSTVFVKNEPSPPLPQGLPPDYGVRPPDYVGPPSDFSVPPPGFNIPPAGNNAPRLSNFNVPRPDLNEPPQIPKAEPTLASIEKEEGELSPEQTNNSLTQNVLEASNQADVLIDADLKPEPMDLVDENDEYLIKEQPASTIENSTFIKCEKTVVKQEPIETFPIVRIKSEPIDPSELSKSSELLNFTELPIRIKSEPADTDELVTGSLTPPLIHVKQERASPICAEDLMSMPTPIHKPAALDVRNQDSVSPPPASANFQTIDGFKFSVEPNQSYLVGMANKIVKKEPEERVDVSPQSKPFEPEPTVTVKQEGGTEELEKKPSVIEIGKVETTPSNILFDMSGSQENEVEIVSVKRPKKAKKERSRSRKKELKKELEKNMDPDIRKLIEDKKKIKRELKLRGYEQYESSASPPSERRRRNRSPSPDSSSNRSPPVAYKRKNRISPIRFPEDSYSRRQLSPTERYPDRSLSPIERSSRRRSPVSPSTSRRWRRSPSPSSCSRYRRRSVSPRDRRSKYQSRSPSDRRFAKSSISPPSRRYKRSPPSPDSRSLSIGRRRQRSPLPFEERNSAYERRPKSPSVRRYSHSTFGDYAYSTYKTKRKSPPFEAVDYKPKKPSPTVLDPKKRKSSPSATSKLKKKKSNGTYDLWDIRPISDLSPISTTGSPDKQSLSSISTKSSAIDKDEIAS